MEEVLTIRIKSYTELCHQHCVHMIHCAEKLRFEENGEITDSCVVIGRADGRGFPQGRKVRGCILHDYRKKWVKNSRHFTPSHVPLIGFRFILTSGHVSPSWSTRPSLLETCETVRSPQRKPFSFIYRHSLYNNHLACGVFLAGFFKGRTVDVSVFCRDEFGYKGIV